MQCFTSKPRDRCAPAPALHGPIRSAADFRTDEQPFTPAALVPVLVVPYFLR